MSEQIYFNDTQAFPTSVLNLIIDNDINFLAPNVSYDIPINQAIIKNNKNFQIIGDTIQYNGQPNDFILQFNASIDNIGNNASTIGICTLLNNNEISLNLCSVIDSTNIPPTAYIYASNELLYIRLSPGDIIQFKASTNNIQGSIKKVTLPPFIKQTTPFTLFIKQI